jgi:hypothetical protein
MSEISRCRSSYGSETGRSRGQEHAVRFLKPFPVARVEWKNSSRESFKSVGDDVNDALAMCEPNESSG